jgi:hypothetical protein
VWLRREVASHKSQWLCHPEQREGSGCLAGRGKPRFLVASLLGMTVWFVQSAPWNDSLVCEHPRGSKLRFYGLS